jgi:hypothetical protein
VSLSGCLGLFPGDTRSPEYPGGSLVVENTGTAPVRVSVETKVAQYNATLDTDVPGGEQIVREEFVTADMGDIVTLEARLGETGDWIRFQFLPAGGDDYAPEVAHLTFENAVEASATWTATSGT